MTDNEKFTLEGKRVEHRIWCDMKSRCQNKNHQNYKYYGGRGILVDPDWSKPFEAFYRYIGPRPGYGYSIGRVNNNWHYEPHNVRWETQEQQVNNKRNSISITIDGISMSVREASELTGKSKQYFYTMINKAKK